MLSLAALTGNSETKGVRDQGVKIASRRPPVEWALRGQYRLPQASRELLERVLTNSGGLLGRFWRPLGAKPPREGPRGFKMKVKMPLKQDIAKLTESSNSIAFVMFLGRLFAMLLGHVSATLV